MTRSYTDELDGFERDLVTGMGPCGVAKPGRGLARLADGLPAVAPPLSLRARVLAAAAPDERLARYVQPITALLDVDERAARSMLARIDDPSAWFELMPGISLLPVDGGPRTQGALRGFVRIRAGTEFPLHQHLGEEAVMIMQGYYADGASGAVFGPGDTPIHPVGSEHSLRVLSDGPDLLGLFVAYGGLRAGEQAFLPF